MLKNLILIIFIVLTVLFMGLFNVDMRENAVVTNNYNKAQTVYGSGIHFTWPGLTNITYVYTNKRTVSLTIPLTLVNESGIATQMLVSWHVSDPKVYVAVINKSDKEHLIKSLVNAISDRLNKDMANLDLSQLNQTKSLINQAIILKNLGIIVDSIELANLQVNLPTNVKESDSLVNQGLESVTLTTLSMSVDNESSADSNQLLIESAYYQAQRIKTQTEIDEANLYGPLRAKNAKFYDYFRKVDIYHQTSESKGDIPPLGDLYKTR